MREIIFIIGAALIGFTWPGSFPRHASLPARFVSAVGFGLFAAGLVL